jgi:hypothetical protein
MICPRASRQETSIADGKHSALLGLLLGGVGKNNSTGCGFFGVKAFDNDILA